MASPCCSRMPVAQPDVSALPAAPGLRKRRARVAGGPPLRASRGQARGRWTAGSTRPARRAPTLARRQRPGRDRADRARLRRMGARPGSSSPDLAAMRRWRLDRLVAEVVARDLGGLLLFDPLNIRYATDSTNMQVWNTHNPFRACLVLPDGHMVLWDYKHAPFLAAHNPLVAELRSGASFFYSRDRRGDRRRAARLRRARSPSVLRAHAGANRRLAVDKIMLAGLPRARRRAGSRSRTASPSPSAPARSRAPTRSARCAARSTPARRRWRRCAAAARPGLSEDEIWAVLHAENIRRGGEWIETRLLDLGAAHQPVVPGMRPADRAAERDPRLRHRPDRPLRLCAPTSRAPGGSATAPPRADMRADYALAREQIARNTALLAARHQLRRAARPRLRPARALPGAAVLLHLARRRALRRVALHRLSRRAACPAPSRACSSPA